MAKTIRPRYHRAMWDGDDQDAPADPGPADRLPDPGTGARNLWSWIVWTEPDEIEVDDEE